MNASISIAARAEARRLADHAIRRCIDIVHTDRYTGSRTTIQAELPMAVATRPRTRKTTVISLRADEANKRLIDRAAAVLGEDRTEFMLDAATREARTVILDRCLFELDDSSFQRFMDVLDAPPKNNPRLRRLMTRRPLWER
jgi:uncharacterized protein (DUF1778 family)